MMQLICKTQEQVSDEDSILELSEPRHLVHMQMVLLASKPAHIPLLSVPVYTCDSCGTMIRRLCGHRRSGARVRGS